MSWDGFNVIKRWNERKCKHHHWMTIPCSGNVFQFEPGHRGNSFRFLKIEIMENRRFSRASAVLILVVLNSTGWSNGLVAFQRKQSDVLSQLSSWEGLEESIDMDPSFLGTFGNIGPTEPLLPVENTKKAQLVKFYLFSNFESRFDPEEVTIDDLTSLVSSSYKKDLPLKILIPGLGASGNCTILQLIKDAYITSGYNYNIVIVDWGPLAADLWNPDPVSVLRNYYIATTNAKLVGELVGDFITFLYRNRYTKLGMVHIIGHGLGSHVAGHAGQRVHEMWLQKISRITGLDPYGPLFTTGRIARHLSERDALFVDLILTDMGRSGSSVAEGNARFHFNGGYGRQPGCADPDYGSHFVSLLPQAIHGTCSHRVAPLMYLETILKTEPFLQARSCFGYYAYEVGLCAFRTLSTVGEYCQPETSGDYYINLTPSPIVHHYTC